MKAIGNIARTSKTSKVYYAWYAILVSQLECKIRHFTVRMHVITGLMDSPLWSERIVSSWDRFMDFSSLSCSDSWVVCSRNDFISALDAISSFCTKPMCDYIFDHLPTDQ